MEANFFRLLGSQLILALQDARIRKIYAPQPGLWTFELSLSQASGQEKSQKYLLFKASSQGLLFFSGHKPSNPAQAQAMVMWWRKRLAGRRILDGALDWPGRRLYLRLSAGESAYLCLDMLAGPSLLEQLPAEAASPATWPDLPEILRDAKIHTRYPQVSPHLREALLKLPEAQAAGLLRDLQLGQLSEVYLGPGSEPLLWASLNPGPDGLQTYAQPLEAAKVHGERELFGELSGRAEKAGQAGERQNAKRRQRRLEHLESDEKRMRELLARQLWAETLAANLHSLPRQAGTGNIFLTHPEAGEIELVLDKSLTPAANLQRFFKLAAKGRRGLAHIERLREALLAGLEISAKPKEQNRPRADKPLDESKFKGIAARKFRSSEGFLMLRGKNAKANHELLSRAASPFDLWFHAKDCPGAHVILRRDHPGQEVGRASLLEAAGLAALASGLAGQAKAEVLCALAGDVRKFKGAALGQVVVDKLRETVLVRPDPELAERLAI